MNNLRTDCPRLPSTGILCDYPYCRCFGNYRIRHTTTSTDNKDEKIEQIKTHLDAIDKLLDKYLNPNG